MNVQELIANDTSIQTSCQKKPNFLCIGAQKAGTTWLHYNLKAHPEIWLPPVKEIHYFDQVYKVTARHGAIQNGRLKKLENALKRKLEGKKVGYKHLEFLGNFALREQKNDDWYLSLFDNAGEQRVIGDVTPAYSALPEEGVAHIRNLLGDIKIIFIMRNPVKRMWSGLVMGKRNEIQRGEVTSVEEWLQLAQEDRNKIRADYRRTIEHYERYFSPENILYLFYDQIRLNPLGFLEEVCNFLDIEFKESDFSQTISGVYNSNPKVTIPDEVKDFLTHEYREQMEWIEARFNPESFEL